MAHRKTGRGLRIAAPVAVAALVPAALLALGLILTTEGGTRLAARLALGWYDDAIPGGAAVQSISGRLCDRFLLRGIELRDRAGAPLISARELEVEWSPLLLFGGSLRVDRVTIRGAEVHLDRETSGRGFRDLAPRMTGPDIPTPGLGPDLPFALLAHVRLEDAALVRPGAPGGDDEIVYVAALDLSLAAAGTRAAVSVTNAAGSAPGVGSADLSFAAGWDEPVAALAGLRATTDLGELILRRAAFDVATLEGFVEAFVDADAGALEERFGIPLERDVSIPVFLAGGPGALRASLAVMDGADAVIEIAATGSVRPVLEVSMTMEAAGGAPFARIHAMQDDRNRGGEIERAWAAVNIDDLSIPAAALSRLIDLPALGGALGAEACCARDRGVLVCRGDARAWDLVVGENGVREAALELGASPLESARPFDAHLTAKGLTLAGQRVARLDATAGGTAAELEVTLRAAGAGDDHLRARATVDLGDGVAVTLHRLGARYRGAWARLAHPATVTYRRRAVAVRDFELRTAGGKVTIDGDIGPDAAGDLTARVSGIRLERLPEAIIGRRVVGRAGLSLRVSGSPDELGGELTASVTGLGIGGRSLGDLGLVASHDGSRLTVDGTLAGRGTGSARLHASAPLHLGLGGIDASPIGRRPFELALTLRQIDLARFAALVPESTLSGVIDARLVFEGTMRAPRATLVASVGGLSVNDLDLGDTELFAAMSEERLYLDLENERGLARSLKLLVEAELSGSPLEAGAIRLARGGFNKASLVARGLRLDLIERLLPGVGIAGVADVDARVSGTPGNPYGRLELNSQRIACRGVVAQPLRVLAEHADGAVVAEVRVAGGPLGRYEASGRLPIRLALDALPRWGWESPHEIDLGVVGLDLGALRQVAARNGVEIDELPVGGHVDVSAVASGTPSNPRLEASLWSGDLIRKTHRLGETSARLGIGGGTARLHAQVVQAEEGFADLVASAPFDIGIRPFEVRWDKRGAHAFRLRADGIDEAVLAPFWEAPVGSKLRLDLGLHGAGSIDGFVMSGEWDGGWQVEEEATVPFRGRIAADLREQSVDLEIGPSGATLASVTARTGIAIDELLRGEGHPKDAPLAAKLAIPGLDLRGFEGLLPSGLYGMEGRLRGELVVDGTLGAPRPRGHLALEKGAITIVELGQRLRGIDLEARLADRRVVLKGMRFSSGQGKGWADGELALADDGSVRASVDVRLRRFPVVKPGLPELTVDSRVAFAVASDRESTEATITLRGTRIELLTSSPSRAPKSLPAAGNITFGSLENGFAAAAPRPSPVDDRGDGPPIRLVIDASDTIEITGPDVDMRWSGTVTAVSASGKNAVSGRIAAEGGRFWLLNNSFVIDSGEVSLPAEGPLDPYLRLVARTEIQAALVTVEIKGRLSRPDLTLSSDPALSQYQILTLLLTGRSDTGEGGEDSEEVRAQAASLLMALNNPVLEQQLGDRLGVDRIGVAMGEDVDEPILAVGKRLGRHFYVETEYHHNAPPTENRAGGRVEYTINSRWSIETFYGDANKGGIDLFWHKRFGRPKPERLPSD